MFNLNGFNPANHLRWPKGAATAAITIAIVGAVACGSDEPAAAVVPQATQLPPAAVLATPPVVPPTRTPTPTGTPLPPATQNALGTLVPVAQESTPTAFPAETINVLATYQLDPDQPITWINPRRWANLHESLAEDPEFDPQHEDYWITGEGRHTRLHEKLSPNIYMVPKNAVPPSHLANNPSQWRQNTVRGMTLAFEIIHAQLVEPQYQSAQARVGEYELSHDRRVHTYERYAIGVLEPFRTTVLDKLAFCLPMEFLPPDTGCHVIHLQQMEQLSESPPVYRITTMLTPHHPTTSNHHYAQVLVSAVYTIDGPPTVPLPANAPFPSFAGGSEGTSASRYKAIQVGQPTLDYVERVTPVGTEPPPQRLLGIDPENIAFMLRCATDPRSFRELLNPNSRNEASTSRATNPLSKFRFTFDELHPRYNHTAQSLALLAHDHFQLYPCNGYCRTGFYQSEAYVAMANRLNDYLTRARESLSPDIEANPLTCPNRLLLQVTPTP